MHFERIYIQDNFVPNYDIDPFRRRVVGISVCFKKGESVNDAIAQGEQFISEYIKANTILPTREMKGTHIKDVVDFDSPDYEKKPMDIIVKGWYEKAVAENDTVTIEALEKEFIVPNA